MRPALDAVVAARIVATNGQLRILPLFAHTALALTASRLGQIEDARKLKVVALRPNDFVTVDGIPRAEGQRKALAEIDGCAHVRIVGGNTASRVAEDRAPDILFDELGGREELHDIVLRLGFLGREKLPRRARDDHDVDHVGRAPMRKERIVHFLSAPRNDLRIREPIDVALDGEEPIAPEAPLLVETAKIQRVVFR